MDESDLGVGQALADVATIAILSERTERGGIGLTGTYDSDVLLLPAR